MENQDAIIYLNTPLLQPEPDEDRISENTYRLQAKVLSETPTGFVVQIKALGNNKGWYKDIPFKKLFIPLHKIDYVTLDG